MGKIVFYAMFLILLFETASFGQNSKGCSSRKLIYKDCTVPYELVLLSDSYPVGHIFMLAEENNFNENDLTILFHCLSKKYTKFSLLTITLFSDRNNLDAAIRGHLNPPVHTNPPIGTSKEDCENLKEASSPCPLGYFRAFYFRFDGKEFFDFSENKDKVSLKRILLQKK